MKIADTTEDAWKIQETYSGQPHAWIQWKGTNVCMDVHCKCGAHLHVDADFAHHVQCPRCETTYMCNGHIELIELRTPPGYLTVVAEDEGDDTNEKHTGSCSDCGTEFTGFHACPGRPGEHQW